MTCNLSSACQGAFLVCARGGLCGDTETDLTVGSGGRLAGSDFTIPAGRTAEVPVALTEVGSQLAGQPGGFRADVLINLQDYGNAARLAGAAGPPFLLTSTDKPAPLPAGAVAGCGGRVFVGPDTSCPFAQNVLEAYKPGRNPNADVNLRVSSPTTGLTYNVRCTGKGPHVCTSDTGATVYFY
jgi:hypothetical protein